MKKEKTLAILLMTVLILAPLSAQKKGMESIDQHDLKLHMNFLASDELQGRASGEPGLIIAARYLAARAEHIGLKAVDPDKDYYQQYFLKRRSYNRDASAISIVTGDEVLVNRDTFFMLPATTETEYEVEGRVVFAGYGIFDEEHSYNDFEEIDIRDKIVLLMDRAPMNEDGSETIFDNEKWNSTQNFQYKMQYIFQQEPKAVLLFMDPKSGHRSLTEKIPGLAQYFEKSWAMKGEEEEQQADTGRPRLFFIHTSVADQLMSAVDKDLAEIQQKIDETLQPHSIDFGEVRLGIKVKMRNEDVEIPNVFGIIEGRDPELRNEYVIYTAHYDHVGTDVNGGVFNGADDNASGTVALLEVAEAFLKEKKAPKRSVGILWVSAEEIGLYGSRYFADNPLVPIENIAAVINLDMVSRRQTEKERESNRDDLTIAGGDTVKVIGGLQSKVLMQLNEEALSEMNIPANYEYNDLDHPGRFFYRSDHVNFARKDIPVIFYSTGTHVDYHQLSDDLSNVDYDRFEQMTRLSYLLGYKAANYTGPVSVDNPMSSW